MKPPSTRKTWASSWKVGLIVVLLVGLAIWQRFLPWDDWAGAALGTAERMGAVGKLVFVLMYVAACVLLVPGWPLTVGAGFLYGPVMGTALVSVASVAGATVAFLLGRSLLRSWVEAKTTQDGRWAVFERGLRNHGFLAVMAVRLAPLFPFNLVNYALGATSVRLRDFVFASWLGMLPGTVLYVLLGAGARSLTQVRPDTTASAPWARALPFVLLLVSLMLMVVLGRIARRQISVMEQG